VGADFAEAGIGVACADAGANLGEFEEGAEDRQSRAQRMAFTLWTLGEVGLEPNCSVPMSMRVTSPPGRTMRSLGAMHVCTRAKSVWSEMAARVRSTAASISEAS
jgi:hypothetical protein